MLLDDLTSCPARWGGHPITWQAWEDAATISGPGKEPCPDCGCENNGLLRRGHVTQPGPPTGGVAVLYADQPVALVLLRCTGCARTRIWDGHKFHTIPKGTTE